MQKSCIRPYDCDQAPTHIPILSISSLSNRTVKKRERTSLLNIISVIYKECSESRRKYLQNGCATYRADLSFCLLFWDVYLVTSNIGLLNANYLSLMNLISLNANLKLLNVNLMLLNANFKWLHIQIPCWM